MSNIDEKIAIIIGAGPAGLTAAYELIKHTNIKPIVLEMSEHNGGISRTINHNGNLIDIGGHRFFSKSDVVMEWWKKIIPIESNGNETLDLTYHNKTKTVKAKAKTLKNERNVFLVRNRLSRILFLKKLFNYPLKLNFNTLNKIGFFRSFKIVFSYLNAVLFPIKKEENLEDFFINRFGKQLYSMFFKDYTEKVWGTPCNKIPALWGEQRIKSLNVTKIVLHHFNLKNKKSIRQKSVETSLIEKFLYPKYGPGQLWDLVAEKIIENGGEIHYNSKVSLVRNTKNKVTEVSIIQKNGEKTSFKGDYFISSMPIKKLANSFSTKLPIQIHKIANGLVYRDFITVGLLVKKLNFKKQLKDNWIYIQEKNVKLGRLQIFNNWSPYMVKDKSNTWLGLEYFCNEGDTLWSKTEPDFKNFAISELESINMINFKDVIDSIVIKEKKAYPTYFGTYSSFDKLINHFNTYENLFLIGRNGMHKYNNQDHSMLTAIQTVTNIKNNIKCKKNIWAINTEEEYYEKK